MRREVLRLLGVLLLFVSIMAGGWHLWRSVVLVGFGRAEGGFFYLAFAFLAGVASFFAPCAFALLPGYASYYLGLTVSRGKPAYIGTVTATGILVFYLFLGALVYLLGSAVSPYLRYLKPTVGFVFVLLGLALYTRSFYVAPLSRAIAGLYPERRTTGALAFFLFGVAYAATALGCTLPIFLALVVYPLFTGKLLLGFLAFLSYSTAKAVLMVAVTYLVAYSKDALIKKLAMSTARIKRFSGFTIALIGVYLLYSGGI